MPRHGPPRRSARRFAAILLVSMLSVALYAAAAPAQVLQRQAVVSGGLIDPLFVASPDGDDRLFIVEKSGRIRIFENGALVATPFLDLSATVATGGEGGLLGLAFDPGFANNGRFFVNFTQNSGGLRTFVSSFTVVGDPATSNVANALSRADRISYAQPQNNHNGGWIGFGPDGYLYIASGDGGGANDNATGHTPGTGNAQDLTDNLLGKMLRIDVSGDTGYTSPADNPFVGTTGDDEIYAYGLRNPFRSSFDTLTGDLYIADVGQGDREEVNLKLAGDGGGQNYGWRKFEGTSTTGNTVTPDLDINDTVLPVIEFDHDDQSPQTRASITGGYVYRGSKLPQWYGYYFFGDYVNGTIWAIDTADLVPGATLHEPDFIELTALSLPGNRLSSFGQDANGELYIVDISGVVHRIVPEPASAGMMWLAAASFIAARHRLSVLR